MDISQIKELGAIDGWVDFAGQIIEIKESKQRTKKNRLMTKAKIADQTNNIGAWIYTDRTPIVLNQMIQANGMLREFQGIRYIDYATINSGQQAAQQAPQPLRQAAQQPIAPQNDRNTSIERQAAFKAACEYCGRAGLEPQRIIDVAKAGHYFIATGNDINDIPEPDPSITEPPAGDDDIPY